MHNTSGASFLILEKFDIKADVKKREAEESASRREF